MRRGSSLRVQGRLLLVQRRRRALGFIPAGAGATRSRPCSGSSRRVHPCGCRGDVLMPHRGDADRGSSLRVQGRLVDDRLPVLAVGFIPAGAGATSASTTLIRRVGVHPCGCRGDASRVWGVFCARGSSLRVQGRLFCQPQPMPKPRFIPAGAGATSLPRSAAWMWGVHPCGCRGDLRRHLFVRLPEGSSLRVQGRRAARSARRDISGFIPAGAGATAAIVTGAVQTRVHPCGCRGDVPLSSGSAASRGSSLRVQGRRQLP